MGILQEIEGSVPEHHNKASIVVKQDLIVFLVEYLAFNL